MAKPTVHKAAAKAQGARIKALAAAPVPQTVEEANEAIRRIGEAERHLAGLQAQLSEFVDTAKAEVEFAAAPYKAVIKNLSAGVQTFCEANRKTLTDDGRRKFFAFAAGKVLWRFTPKAVKPAGKKFSWDIILANIQLMRRDNAKLEKFLRRKVEINKDAMLEDEALALTVPGVKIAQVEEFVIEPTEIKLEAVQ